SDDVRCPLRLSAAATARSCARTDGAWWLPGRAGDRLAHQRGAPLDRVRAGDLPAVGAGEARRRSVGRGVSLQAPCATDPARAVAAHRIAAGDLLPADPGRARP